MPKTWLHKYMNANDSASSLISLNMLFYVTVEVINLVHKVVKVG